MKVRFTQGVTHESVDYAQLKVNQVNLSITMSVEVLWRNQIDSRHVPRKREQDEFNYLSETGKSRKEVRS